MQACLSPTGLAAPSAPDYHVSTAEQSERFVDTQKKRGPLCHLARAAQFQQHCSTVFVSQTFEVQLPRSRLLVSVDQSPAATITLPSAGETHFGPSERSTEF